MIEVKNKELCSGCGACVQTCPQKCIAMHDDQEGFMYPRVDLGKCIECGLCEKVCPCLNTRPKENKDPETFAAYNRNNEQRLDSSSGGIFSLLAEEILKKKGIVFGAAFDDHYRSVCHIAIDSIKQLTQLRGSKYLQSETGDSFIKAKQYLDEGRAVLFSGTPCEIEGLKSFLRKDYDNLLCTDMICHGVPSPKVWRKYAGDLENKASSSIKAVTFRNKMHGWRKYSVLTKFENGSMYCNHFTEDSYMQMFLQNLCLRPSCYDCRFRRSDRISDITLADFWGCQNVCPELDDDKGLSLVLIHSEKGRRAFEGIEDKMVFKAVPFIQALRENPAFTESCLNPPNRTPFMNQIDDLTIEELKKKYVKRPSLKAKMMEKVKRNIPSPLRHIIKKFINKE